MLICVDVYVIHVNAYIIHVNAYVVIHVYIWINNNTCTCINYTSECQYNRELQCNCLLKNIAMVIIWLHVYAYVMHT